MTRTLILGAILALSLDHVHCQDLPKAPAFEVASITPCPPETRPPAEEHSGAVQFTFPGGRFYARATTLTFLLEWAYGIQPSQHSGGPSWMDVDRYDVVAKAEGSATDAQMKQMVQTLLAERFKLKFHREKKDMSAYVISIGKAAPKLSPAKEGETHSIRAVVQTSSDQKPATYHVIATRFTLEELSDVFARQLGGVIINRTGLHGEYDFTVDLTPDESRPNVLDPTLLLTALREQLGLTLKSQKVPVDILVVDSAEKVVAGN